MSKLVGTLLLTLFLVLNATAAWAQGGGPFAPNVEVIAINPSDSATLYAGTGGGGVFKSANGGATWGPASNGLTYTIVFSVSTS